MFPCVVFKQHEYGLRIIVTARTACSFDMSALNNTPPSASPTPQPHARAGVQNGLREIIWLCGFLMFGLVVMSRSQADPDLWGHVTYGKEVIRDGHLHATTTWSYAVTDNRWVNHENIAELLMAAADAAGGQHALLLVQSGLALIVLGFPMIIARRQGAGLVTCFLVVALMSFNISFHWMVRPHMLSYASAAILVGLLAIGLPGAVGPRRPGNAFSRCLWLIPAVMCFWTNAHGGYLAGLAILTAWLGLDAMELVVRRDERMMPAVRHHLILWTVTVAACLVNPYGLELHEWMLSSLGRPRPEISEWAPLPLFGKEGLPFWVLLLTGAFCIARSECAFRWPGMVVLGLLGWQAIQHYRHLPFVAIVAGYLLAPHLESTVRRIRAQIRENHLAARQHVTAQKTAPGLLGGLVLLIVLSATQYPRQAELRVDRKFYPVSAMQFMADRDLGGRVFVTFNWAQYALAVFSETNPESRIAIDGRFRTCYPQPVIDMYFDFILGDPAERSRYREGDSGPFNPGKALEFGNPNLVLFERRRQHCVETMQAAADDWCLLYQDEIAQLWGRRSLYDDPQSPNYLPLWMRCINDATQEGTEPWPAFPRLRADLRQVAMARETIMTAL